MALELSCDEVLSEALRTVQADGLFNHSSELCDQKFNSMTNNNGINCEYMDIYHKTLYLQNDSNSVILMHLNIRSVQKNYDDLYNLVVSLSFRPDVICLSEAHINQPLKSIQLQGYILLMQSLTSTELDSAVSSALIGSPHYLFKYKALSYLSYL